MQQATKASDSRPYAYFRAEPLSGALGVELLGASIAGSLPDSAIAEIHRAMNEFKVVFFRDQPLEDSSHVALARRFSIPQGPGAIPPVDGFPMMRHQQYDQHARMGSDVNFHSDDTFRDYPSKISIFRALEVPEHGGDTIWVDMEKAFDALSPAMQVFLEGLTAEHTVGTELGLNILRQGGGKAYDDMMRRNPPVTHPVVCDQRPSRNPAAEPVRDFGNVDMVRTEDLFLRKPELAYGSASAGGNGASAAADSKALLDELNSKEPGMSFTPEAAERVGKIPAMFRGNALSQIFDTARKNGVSRIEVALLDEVMAKRRG